MSSTGGSEEEEKSNNDNDNDASKPTTPSGSQSMMDPYAILNISSNASMEEIQKGYKILSRSFHPDKQPIGDKRDQAQQYFILLKGAYDILMDPVLKLAYDMFGCEGVTFLRRHSKLYEKISILLEGQRIEQILKTNTVTGASFRSTTHGGSGSSNIGTSDEIMKQAISLLSEAMQYYKFQKSLMDTNRVNTSGSIKVQCNTTHSHLLQEGIEPLSLEVDESSIQFTVSQPASGNKDLQSHRKIGYNISTSTAIKSRTGEGSTNGQVSFEYEPVQGTKMHADVASQLNLKNEQLQQKKQKQQLYQPKITLGSSRMMSNETYAHASLTASLSSLFFMSPRGMIGGGSNNKNDMVEQDNDIGLSFTSHRSLFKNKMSCTFVSGISLPSTKLQYGLISLSTNNNKELEEENASNDNDKDESSSNNSGQKRSKMQQLRKSSKPAKYTLKLNIGMNYTPLQIIAEKEISESHTGLFKYGYGMRGMDIHLLSTRSISKFCQLSLGLRHVSAIGLTTFFQIQRGSINFTVPVLVSTMMSPSYAMKSIYVSLFMSLVDGMVGDILGGVQTLKSMEEESRTNKNKEFVGTNDGRSASGVDVSTSILSIDEMLMERERVKRNALQQIKLMSKAADAKMKNEQKKEGGLVIMKAVYEVEGGDSVDVTVALQFWVISSSLHLPSLTKSNMLGFYDVRREVSMKIETDFWQACWMAALDFFNTGRKSSDDLKQQEHLERSSTPTLTIRYRYCGNVYEISILDHEELSLPSKKAMMLGGSFVT